MAIVVSIATRHPEIASRPDWTMRTGVSSCSSNQTGDAGGPDLMPHTAIEGGWPEDRSGAN
jgi:hypothetical protein